MIEISGRVSSVGDSWWQSFFDEQYLALWGESIPESQSVEEAKGLWEVLQLEPGSRLLDAPCGYGRISRQLALLGAYVVGVDQSSTLLEEAEKQRGGLDKARLHYRRHDLRESLGEKDFNAAINIFSSLGYGTEEEDRAILRNLKGAVKPGGLVFVETNHRDAICAFLSKGCKPAMRLPSGTLMLEELKFDPLGGRIETCWYWSGPKGSGKKEASLRVYTATELIQLMEEAGLEFESARSGCSTRVFDSTSELMGGRLGLLARRPREGTK